MPYAIPAYAPESFVWMDGQKRTPEQVAAHERQCLASPEQIEREQKSPTKKRLIRVLALRDANFTNKEIAVELHMSIHAVNYCIRLSK